MIISASRRTDIPNYYSEWLYRRIEEEVVCVRNPFRYHQVSRISLSPEVVDGFVFWTKNPQPMFGGLERLNRYPFYFQFTLNGYEQDVEPNIPDKWTEMIPVFQELSGRIGAERVIWRYDPIFLNEHYTLTGHVQRFERIAKSLAGYTDRVVISFLDFYGSTKAWMRQAKARTPNTEERLTLARELSSIAHSYRMEPVSCAEEIDLLPYGIRHGSCVDVERMGRIGGCRLKAPRDQNQRKACGCGISIDIGCYHTCGNGCGYCYAGGGCGGRAGKNCNPDSPLLCSEIDEEDVVRVREIASYRENQMTLEEFL